MAKKLLSAGRLSIAASTFLVLVIVAALLSRSPRGEDSRDLLILGTGPVSGLYYPTGGMIAGLVNRRQEAYGFRLAVEPTDGALTNIDQVVAGKLDFAITQADLEHQAVHGEGPWQATGPRDRLRAIASLLPETVVLVAAVAGGVERLEDVRGKRVDIGPPGSGRRKNAQQLLRSAGIDWTSDLVATELPLDETIAGFAAGELDAAFLTVGHPSEALTAITRQSEVRFVELASGDFLAQHPDYVALWVPSQLYPEAADRQPVATVGTKATLVTSVEVAEDYVYAITSSLFENLEEARSLHPAFAFLEREQMLRGFAAPVHPGALRYFRQTEEEREVGRGGAAPG